MRKTNIFFAFYFADRKKKLKPATVRLWQYSWLLTVHSFWDSETEFVFTSKKLFYIYLILRMFRIIFNTKQVTY